MTSPLEALRALESLRFSWGNEAELQDGIAQALDAAGVAFEREVVFRVPRQKFDGRINVCSDRADFVIDKLLVEVKCRGSLAALTRQLHRYAGLDEVEELAVVTPLAKLTRLPSELRDKPVHVIHLLRSAL